MGGDEVERMASARERMPAVSVIVPSYKKPELLRECLASIRMQTFEDWECIVVDDGSPLGKEIQAVVSEMADERFRLVVHEHTRGPAAARNTGVRHARGEYILLVDEDDRIVPDCLEVLLKQIRATGADIVCPHAKKFGGAQGFLRSEVPTLEEVLSGRLVIPWGFLLKRELWLKLGGQEEAEDLIGREDHEWWVRVRSANIRVVIVNRVLIEWRVWEDGVLGKLSLNFQAARQEVKRRQYVVEKHRDLYERHPWAKRRYLRVGYLREGYHRWQEGRRTAALVRYWQAYFMSRDSNDFRLATKMTLMGIFGESAVLRFIAFRKHFFG
ncbi:MAG: glycosyltransferase family 2 protein [Thermogemmata sp.]